MITQISKSLPLFLIGALLFMAGCGGSSSEAEGNLLSEGGVKQDPDDIEVGLVYSGPLPGSDDVNSFKLNVWDNLAVDERCGGCHNETVGQEPMFMRRDDINEAYQTINPIVDLLVPQESRIVTKVAGGHNCWSDQASVCAEIITNYIQAWASDSGAASENTIVLTAPEEKEVGVSLKFPEDSAVFEATIYPVLRENCAACHAEDGTRMRQQPYFASAEEENGQKRTAYLAAQAKINLNDAAALRDPVEAGAPRPSSRLIVRVRDEGHNCWQDPGISEVSCSYSSTEMTDAIAAFLNGIPEPEAIDEELQAVASRAVNLVQDGVIASSGGRFESNVIALYEFKFGQGGTAFDYSGEDPALDLNLTGDVSWVGSWGVRFGSEGGRAQGDTASSKKIHDRIRRTGEYSIESWVIPANVTQEGPARIVTYSGDGENRNFTLGQQLYDYNFLSRSSEIDQEDLFETPANLEVLQATLQHVVVNYDPLEGRKLFVNGELVAEDTRAGGNLNSWNDTYALALGGEVDGMDQFAGTIRLLAIHERQLTYNEEDGGQVRKNFEAGVGQKYYLLFGVSHLVDMPEAFVVFQVEVFDDYSYLFTSPFFISLDREATPPEGGIRIAGIRLGMNGNEASLGQAYVNVDTTVTRDNYNPETGTPLAAIGTVIASEQGQSQDEFFLTFENIGDKSLARAALEVPAPPAPSVAAQNSDFGTRNFGEINATLSKMTGIDANTSNVKDIYQAVIQQLPQVPDVDAFLASHQSGIMQLSVAYCTELVETPGDFFGGTPITGTITTEAQANVFLTPLIAGLTAQEVEGAVLESSAELVNPLVDVDTTVALPDNDPSKDLVKTEGGAQQLLAELMIEIGSAQPATIAACTALAGSAAMLMQ